MVENKTPSQYAFDVFNTVFLALLMVVTIYPLLYCLFASISDPTQLIQNVDPLWRPLGFSVRAYQQVFQNPKILTGYRNTLFVIVVGTALNLLLTSLGAYFLSRQGILFGKFITFFIIFTMFFNGGMIPTYLIVRSLGLSGSLWALIFPVGINTYNLIVMRTAFASVPPSMEESAKIDGATDFTVLFRIFIPLSKATVAVMILFYGAYHWNAWFNAMIYLRDNRLYPLQLILREVLLSNSGGDMMAGITGTDIAPVGQSVRYATVMVATVPILCAYPFLQKYFVKGVMIGAIKS